MCKWLKLLHGMLVGIAHSLELYSNALDRVDGCTAAMSAVAGSIVGLKLFFGKDVQLCIGVALQDVLVKRREGADGHLQLVRTKSVVSVSHATQFQDAM